MVCCFDMKSPRAILPLLLLLAFTPALASGQATPVTPEEVVSPGTAPATLPAIAAAPDDEFLVAWRALTGIFVRRMDASGRPVSEPIQVNDDPARENNVGPSLAVNAGNTALVIWPGGNPVPGAADFGPILGRIVAPVGLPVVTDPLLIAERGREARVAALSNGSFVVVWESVTPDLNRIELVGRVLDSSGAPKGGIFQVPRRQGYDFQGGPEIAANPKDGGFVVVWERGQRRPEIVMRPFDDLGKPTSDELVVDRRPRVTQPAVGVAPDGRITVVWSRVGVIYGRRFAADTGILSPAFPIAATPRETRIQPVIAFDSAGDSVVAWNRSRQPTAAAQLFTASGRFAGPHFLFTKNLPNLPPGIQVTFLTGGRLAAVWSGRDLPFLGGALQILERIFEIDLP
jgi:hypothetical protein